MTTKRPESILRSFGETVRHRRLELELSQEELAQLTGLHRTYIGGIERGERNPSLRNIERIAIALRATLGELFSTVTNR